MCVIDWSAVAAWVQAIGSVLAIFAAIWVGERSSKQSRNLVENERRRQADIAASTIAMKFHLASVELQKKSQHALAISAQVKSGQIPKLDKIALNKLFLLTRYESLAQLRSNVMLFDRDTGIFVNAAFDIIDDYNPTIELSITTYEYKGCNPNDLIELCSFVFEQMTCVADMCSQTENRLERVHDLDRAEEN